MLFFKVSFLCGLLSAIGNGVNDCDEAYNYLEPLYLLVGNGTGTAFQTWEYSPEYALRSYFYLWLIGWPALVISNLNGALWLMFLCVRLQLILLSSYAISSLASGFSKKLYPKSEVSAKLSGLLFCVIYAFSPGYFVSVTSVVPSSLSSTMTVLMLASWINGRTFLSVGCIAMSTIICWPFTAALGIPLALSLCLSNKITFLIKTSLFWLIVIVPFTVVIDSFYYGRLVSAAFNILKYNVLGSFFANGSSSQLYGTEPGSFYVKNYLLNFNVAIILLVCTPFCMLYCLRMITKPRSAVDFRELLKQFVMCVAPFMIWNTIFFLQPHKEERFLFPCYPCLCLAVTLIFVTVHSSVGDAAGAKLGLYHLFCVLFVSAFVVASASRITSLSLGYHAPIFLTQHLPQPIGGQTNSLCLGREWHYFPSQFFLPEGDGKWEVGFLPSDFHGQLPGKFAGKNTYKATRTAGSAFNDQNQLEMDRYFELKKCRFIIDRDSPPGKFETLYIAKTDQWISLAYQPILEPSGGKQPFKTESLTDKAFKTFIRAFYVPKFYSERNYWVNMHILENIHFRDHDTM